MSHTEDQLWDLLHESWEMPYGAARTALVEQVIGHADAQQLADLAFAARLAATSAYVYGGEPARSFVTFSWCLAEFDRDPVRYANSRHTLLWQFKATVTGLTRFPEIPLDRTYAVLDEMERRWREGGHSLHAVYAHRHFVARHLGQLDEAEEWYQQWCTAARDELSDCVGCDPSSKAHWLARRGRHEEAVRLAQDVLSGRLTCSEQPQGILTTIMTSYLRTGRLDEARDAHRRAYRLHRPNLADLGDIADHIEFCARTGNEARGLEILQRHLGWLEKAPSPYAAMSFAASGALLLDRALGLGDEVVIRRADGTEVGADALRAELHEQALATAARFDARNQTGYVTDWVRELLAAEPIVAELPLSPTAARRAAAPSPAPQPVAPTKSLEAFEKRPVDPGVLTDPDALLDAVEEALRGGRRKEAFRLCEAFDERFATAELTGLQRGRRADAYGVDAAVRGEEMEAETAWRSAVELFAAAGDEVRRQATRGRIGRLICGRHDDESAPAGLAMVEESVTYLLAYADRERWAGALYSLAAALGDLGRMEEALATLDRTEEYVRECPDPSMPAVIAIGRAQCLGALERIDESRVAAETALRLCRELGFEEGHTHAAFLVGLAAERLGDPQAALTAYDEAVATAVDAEALRRARLQRAGVLASSPRAAEAIDDFVEEVAARTAAGDPDGATRARHGLAIAYLNAGRPLDSAEVAEEALGFLTDHDGDPDGGRIISLRHLLSAVYQRLGQPNEAITQLELISAECARNDNPAGVGQMAEEVGDILDRMDHDAAAAQRYLAAADAFRRAELPIEEFRNRRQHALSLLWAGDHPGALEAMARADEASLELPTDEHGTWERASMLFDGARILRGVGRHAEAALRAASAATTYRRIGFPVQSAHAEMLLAELLLQESRPAEAEAAARRGLADLPEGESGADRLTAILDAAQRAQQSPPAEGPP